jgi:hypothetical protein
MEYIIHFLRNTFTLYSYCIDKGAYLHNNLLKYNLYKSSVQYLSFSYMHLMGYINNYDIEESSPYNALMYLDDNYNLIINYNCDKSESTKHSHNLFYNKFNINADKKYIQSNLLSSHVNTKCTVEQMSEHMDIANKFNFKSKFMAIQYTHPKMNEELILNLDKEFFVINNDILDSIFVKYFLSHNYNKNKYLFDKDYKINIIDNDCNYHSLDYNSYIRFEECNWKIKIKNT